jgi:hypothetical protein
MVSMAQAMLQCSMVAGAACRQDPQAGREIGGPWLEKVKASHGDTFTCALTLK